LRHVERGKNGTARHLGTCAPGAGSPDFRAFPVKPAGKRRCPNPQGFGGSRQRSAALRRVERGKNGTARHLGTCAPGAGSPDFRAFPVKPAGETRCLLLALGGKMR
jgi:hypothetical protein